MGERLSQDAVGECFAAVKDGAPRALRILREDLAGRDDALLLFAEEIRRVGRIAHPGLLAVHRQEARGTRPWMLTDPVDRSLKDHVQAAGPLGPEEALALAGSLASAFAYLEGRRQVHAAPVPARIVRVEDGWRLLTFRDIRAWDELKSLKGKRYAQADFAPPERDRAHPDRLSPHPHLAWALGAVLRFAVGSGAPRTPEGSAADLPARTPEAVAGIIRSLADPQPARRPQGERAVAAALAGEGASGGGPEAPIAIKAPVRKRRRKRRR